MPLLQSFLSVFIAVLKWASRVIFVLLLTFYILLLSASQFTDEGSLRPVLVGTFVNALNSTMNASELSEMHANLTAYCAANNGGTLILPTAGGSSINITCAEVGGASDEGLLELEANETFDYLYNTKYACGFIDCLRHSEDGNLLVLVSRQGHLFLEGILDYVLAGVVLFGLVVVLSYRTLAEMAKGMGKHLIFVGLYYVPLVLFNSSDMGSGAELAKPVLDKLFGILAGNFLVVLAAGAVLYIMGFAIGRLEKKKKDDKPLPAPPAPQSQPPA